MVQKVETRLVDDIDGSDAAETVTFALEGRQYEIDLSTKNAQDLRDRTAMFVASARQIGGRRSGSRRASTSGPAPAAVRAWAQANGIEVSNRGRIPSDVLRMYEGRDRQPVAAEPAVDE